METRETDILILGAGLAALAVALRLDRPCLVLTRDAPGAAQNGGSSFWAQGGMAAALADGDSLEQHSADTLAVGGGLSDPAAARWLAAAAPRQIAWLESLGMPFDRDAAGALALGREGGHGQRRVVHSGGDRTGQNLMRFLGRLARTRPHIQLLSGTTALSLLTNAHGACVGARAVQDGRLLIVRAGAVVLATGGCGQLFAHTTNPPAAAGEGLALAARAGAQLVDLEFVQFHPTALLCARDPLPLLTEALRGDGAQLVTAGGARFMPDAHKDAELAPRDIVARAIMQANKHGQAYLDARMIERASARYPQVAEICAAENLDMTRDLLPVTPAAHYHMGGVAVDLRGRSSVAGLYACGEVAATGVHGANRLASNSLTEALAGGEAVAQELAGQALSLTTPAALSEHVPPPAPESTRGELRRIMFAQCGLVRDAAGLERAASVLATLSAARTQADNRLLAARLIVAAAAQRLESRGAHWRADFTDTSLQPVRKFLTLTELLGDEEARKAA